ncbi:oxygenase MpaB family protein [Rhizobium sp. K7/93]
MPDCSGPVLSAGGSIGDFPSMLVGGISMLLPSDVPLTCSRAGLDHSNFRDDMLGRFRRTARFVSATTFAPREQATGEIERVNRIHAHIRTLRMRV